MPSPPRRRLYLAKRGFVRRSKFTKTYQEIAYEFGGYSLFKNVEGIWVDEKGKVYRDVHNVVLILAADTPKTREWLLRYKKLLEKQFEQKEMFIKVSGVRKI